MLRSLVGAEMCMRDSSSTDLGCGALELVHPIGGLPYRALKGDLLRKVVAGRAGLANFVRLVRAAFVAAHLDVVTDTHLTLPTNREAERPIGVPY